MNPYAIIAALVLSICLAGGGYLKGRHDEASDAIETQRNGLLAYAERIKQGVEQNDKDRAVIDKLHNDVERLRNTVHIPTCTQDTNEAGRVLSVEVDRLFGQFQERISGLIEEADKLNIDAIRANSLMIDEYTRSVPDHKP
jgi:outer membrane murein-binding lipoprotein Lpp